MICEGLSEEEKGGRRWKPYFLDDLMRTLAFVFLSHSVRYFMAWAVLCAFCTIDYLYYIQRFSVYWICSFFGSLGTGRLAFEAHSLIERSEIRNVIQKPGPSVRRITVSPVSRLFLSTISCL